MHRKPICGFRSITFPNLFNICPALTVIFTRASQRITGSIGASSDGRYRLELSAKKLRINRPSVNAGNVFSKE